MNRKDYMINSDLMVSRIILFAARINSDYFLNHVILVVV